VIVQVPTATILIVNPLTVHVDGVLEVSTGTNVVLSETAEVAPDATVAVSKL
jgi:hypothetical protein